jgi:hypothetical protein
MICAVRVVAGCGRLAIEAHVQSKLACVGPRKLASVGVLVAAPGYAVPHVV